MQRTVLLIGSNQGERLDNLYRARQLLEKQAGKIMAVSSVYHTEPWGFESPERFLNQALLLSTDKDPGKLLETIHMIEAELGRHRPLNLYASRTIDIDLIFYGQSTIHTPELTIPHPLMHLRKFVLIPLNEIVPDFIHPLTGKTVKQMLSACEDSLGVELMQSDEV